MIQAHDLHVRGDTAEFGGLFHGVRAVAHAPEPFVRTTFSVRRALVN